MRGIPCQLLGIRNPQIVPVSVFITFRHSIYSELLPITKSLKSWETSSPILIEFFDTQEEGCCQTAQHRLFNLIVFSHDLFPFVFHNIVEMNN